MAITQILLMINILHYLKDLRTLNYGNYGIFLIMGNAGFLTSTVVRRSTKKINRSNPEAIKNLNRLYKVYLLQEPYTLKSPQPIKNSTAPMGP